jgi:hypothetical protein
MKQFIRRLFIVISIPLFLIILFTILYIKRDVYYDFRKYKNYSWKYNFQVLGDVSTKKLLNSQTNYNTFIFGSSRTISLYACYLQSILNNSKVFHYGSWNETIGGIYEKIKLLDSLEYHLDNVIIYLDTDFTFLGDGKCRPNDHFLLTHIKKFNYYYVHYQAFFSDLDLDKLKILLGEKVEGEIFPNWETDTITNDYCHCSDSLISVYGKRDLSKEYYHKIDSLIKVGFLYKRPGIQKFLEKQVSIQETEMISGILNILNKHHAKYYVIITPLYDQLKFNENDMKILKNSFGNNLYDFSGINRFTDDKLNYPDRKHFTQYVSKQILDSILKPQNLY